jgi:hypothetical protein
MICSDFEVKRICDPKFSFSSPCCCIGFDTQVNPTVINWGYRVFIQQQGKLVKDETVANHTSDHCPPDVFSCQWMCKA